MSPVVEFNEGYLGGEEGVPEPLNKKAHAADWGHGLGVLGMPEGF